MDWTVSCFIGSDSPPLLLLTSTLPLLGDWHIERCQWEDTGLPGYGIRLISQILPMKTPNFPCHGSWHLDKHVTQDASVLSYTSFIEWLDKTRFASEPTAITDCSNAQTSKRQQGRSSQKKKELEQGSKDLKFQLWPIPHSSSWECPLGPSRNCSFA